MKGAAAFAFVLVSALEMCVEDSPKIPKVPATVASTTHVTLAPSASVTRGKYIPPKPKPTNRGVYWDECGNAFGPDGLAFHYPLYRCHSYDYDFEVEW